MIRNPELPTISKELSLRDFKMMLPGLIPSAPTMLLTDFDETLCSTYEYEALTKTHKPNINVEIVSEASRVKSPIVVATSRSAGDRVVAEFSSSISQGERPIICENGAVVFFPSTNEAVCLVDGEQKMKVRDIGRSLNKITEEFLDDKYELVVSPHRLATLELRVQDRYGHGSSEMHSQMVDFIDQNFDLSGLAAVSSHNSVSVQPIGIDKGSGFLAALKMLNLNREDFFVIGLGDAPNDESIFRNSNLAINVRRNQGTSANFTIDAGEKVALSVMTLLK